MSDDRIPIGSGSIGVDKAGLANERSTIEGAQRFYSAAFNKLKSELLHRELQKKTKDLECLRNEVGRAKRKRDELRARVDTQISANKDALAKASSLKVQLHNAHENILVQIDMISRLESKLLKMKDEVVDARAEAKIIQAKADKKVATYLKDASDARAELRGDLDQEIRNKEYARCKSRRETLEEIHAMSFDLSEEIKQAKAEDYDAKFLLSNAEDDEKEADGP
ncbi:uncharacterized protein [Nicotiana sylvestris]|uniref:uncharacterized protein n=1 Tax=Nicotiana sylvestris TaxID=4096 RepID=UPI00388CBEC6